MPKNTSSYIIASALGLFPVLPCSPTAEGCESVFDHLRSIVYTYERNNKAKNRVALDFPAIATKLVSANSLLTELLRERNFISNGDFLNSIKPFRGCTDHTPFVGTFGLMQPEATLLNCFSVCFYFASL